LKEYYIDNIRDIKLDLIDLLLSYINFVVNAYILTDKEMYNIGILKLYFKIKEGDFYKYRYEAIKSVCQKQYLRLNRDNHIDYYEELFLVKMQDVFDLSYEQLEKLKQIK